MGDSPTPTSKRLSRRAAIVAVLAELLRTHVGAAERQGRKALPVLPGVLSIDLNLWTQMDVHYQGRWTTVTSAEIFRALEETAK